MYTEMHSVWRAKARHNADFIVLLFILFQILKSEGLAAGEEEDAGWIFFYLV